MRTAARRAEQQLGVPTITVRAPGRGFLGTACLLLRDGGRSWRRRAGVRAVVQPGGSVRDTGVIAAAEAAGVPLYLTGTRHFAH